MKKCKTCGLEKKEIEFFKSKRWLEGQCKQCKREKIKERESKDPEKYKEKERLRNLKRNDTIERKKWRQQHQEKNREIISIKAREYYSKNKENLYKKAKEWREKNLEKYEKSLKIHKENNLEKVRARKILNYHVNVGNMTKPIFCSNCQEKTKIEAHHENYLKPLDIIWLCRQCHKLIHRKYKD